MSADDELFTLDPAANGLLAVFEKFRHLDRVLRECETADDPIYRTCAQLWIAVAEAQTDNAPRDLRGGSRVTVHADVRQED